MTGQQIINSIQQGNMALTQQICNCCCDIKTGIKDQTIALQGELNSVNRSVERGFADVGYATRDQTCNIEKAIRASTESILAGQRAAEMREMQREIAERDRRIAEQAVIINNAQQSAAFAQMIGQAVAPLNAGINSLNTEIAGIKCHLPETKVIPCGDNFVENMPTIIKIKERQADKLYECAEKVHRGAKKLMEFIEDEILESEEFDERYGGGGNGGGTGGYRDEDDDDDEDYNERRGVPGTGRYGRRRYGRGRRY